MREINRIVVHCAATKPGMDIRAAEIDRWHRDRGWSRIGYHAVIRRDGKLEAGREPWFKGAHAKGNNHDSIGVCLVGGIDKDGRPERNFLQAQYNTLRQYLDEAQKWYGPLEILGHCDLPDVAKACPCFDVRKWLGELT